MKILFAGDLSFDWMSRPGLLSLLYGKYSLTAENRKILQKIKTQFPSPDSRGFLSEGMVKIHADLLAQGIRGVTEMADYFCVNLECPLTSRGTAVENKRFTIKAIPEYVTALKILGISAVSLANNHILDYGPQGLDDTIKLLELAKIKICGIQTGRQKIQNPAILGNDVNKVALLGFVEPGIIDPAPGVFMNLDPRPFPLDKNSVIENIESVSRQMPVIVILHWGEEWCFLESDDQRDFAHACVDHGASAVIGHHSHLVSGLEEYNGRPIAYGLGNYYMILPPFSTRRAKERLLLGLEFKDGNLCGYEAIPLSSDTGGYPLVSDSFSKDSLGLSYLPENVPDKKDILFDSFGEIKEAEVIAESGGNKYDSFWRNKYLRNDNVIRGRIPISPGWEVPDLDWTGAARSREFMDKEYLMVNNIHMQKDSEVMIRFYPKSKLKRLYLIYGFPDYYKLLKEIKCPELKFEIDGKTIHNNNVLLKSDKWNLCQVDTDSPAEKQIIRLSATNPGNSRAYLVFRILGV